MTKQTISTTPSGATDALFRTWGLAHSTAMAAVAPARFAKTADTGQINWATVTKPAAASAVQGYEIWKLTDAGLADIYLKLSYGASAAVGGNVFALTSIVVGTGTDGAGTITGTAQQTLTTPPPNASATAGATGAISNSYISCPAAGGSLVMVWNALSYNAGAVPGLVLVLDRTRSSTGVANTGGLGILMGRWATTPLMSITMSALNLAVPGAVAAGPPVAILPDATQAANGSIVYVARHYVGLPALYPILAALTYLNGEITAFTTFPCVPIGTVSRTFLTLGSTSAGNASGNQSGFTGSNAQATNEAIQSLAVIWED